MFQNTDWNTLLSGTDSVIEKRETFIDRVINIAKEAKVPLKKSRSVTKSTIPRDRRRLFKKRCLLLAKLRAGKQIDKDEVCKKLAFINLELESSYAMEKRAEELKVSSDIKTNPKASTSLQTNIRRPEPILDPYSAALHLRMVQRRWLKF